MPNGSPFKLVKLGQDQNQLLLSCPYCLKTHVITLYSPSTRNGWKMTGYAEGMLTLTNDEAEFGENLLIFDSLREAGSPIGKSACVVMLKHGMIYNASDELFRLLQVETL